MSSASSDRIDEGLAGTPKLVLDPSFLQSVNVSIVPRQDGAFDLGDGTTPLRWRNLFLSGDIDLGGSIKINGTEVIDSSRNLVGINLVAQNLSFDADKYIKFYNEPGDKIALYGTPGDSDFHGLAIESYTMTVSYTHLTLPTN